MSVKPQKPEKERKPPHKLTVDQLQAIDPSRQVWLSASAGTGKTQVLTARVIRLLMSDNIRPEHILCITFTKAGAAEMAERINAQLARWVQEDGDYLFHELEAIGIAGSPDMRERARSLFASVLDAPGGGLQILTIHSLAQSFLGSFPEEAGVIPGFNPVEEREQEQLYKEALNEMVLEAERDGRDHLIKNLQSLSIAMGEDGAFKFLKRCAQQLPALGMVADDKGALILARRLAGVNFEGSVQDMLAEALQDSVIDRQAIEALAQANVDWSTKTGLERAEKQKSWLAMDISQRVENFDLLRFSWTTKSKGECYATGPKKDPSYGELMSNLHHWTQTLFEQIILSNYADRLASALLAGKAFALRYAQAKKIRGLIDFNDMIRMTSALLSKPGMGDWIRYKLDSRIDHILVDESQDTNLQQWDIIEALSDDFFSGSAAKEESRARTVFSVGDEKQAIFSFQGTDPAEYRDARIRFNEKISLGEQELDLPSLDQSFRSNKPILDAVNAVFHKASDEMGEPGVFRPHRSELPDVGTVELIQLVTSDMGQADDEENWVSDSKRILASRIARRVSELLKQAPFLKSTGKRLRAGDIMILLRNRSTMAASLVAQLHSRGVPVAGIDRLKIAEPVVVQDLLSAIRFVLQPADDHSLACLLVSPLIGWDQEKLLKYGYRPKGAELWAHIKQQDEISADLKPLYNMLSSADFGTPYQFLEQILSGETAGRAKFAARIGNEALIPMEEMLNLALHFEQQGGGTLQSFLRWFESEDEVIKREMMPNSDELRVMTVHGAKGLQAPVVIMADVASDPSKTSSDISLRVDEGELPLINITSKEKFGRLEGAAKQQKESDVKEHLRLLYVAMTRAQEHLIMAGSLNEIQKGNGAPEFSWYPHLEEGMKALNCGWSDDALFGQVMRYEGGEKPPLESVSQDEGEEGGQQGASNVMPDWISLPAPQESRPPRPLVPSRVDDDDYGEPPSQGGVSVATEKGRLLHMLFERISGDDPSHSMKAAAKWLSQQDIPSGLTNEELIGMVSGIINNPQYAEWFGPNSHAELPLSAIVGDMVISGRVDRLLVTDEQAVILDFKTGRQIPSDETQVSTAFLKQMAHYTAALEVIFPEKQVGAALLYTAGPQMIMLSDGAMRPHRPKRQA